MVWSDECSIELGSGQARPYAFWLEKASFDDDRVMETSVKGTKVMLWAVFTKDQKSEAAILQGDPLAPRGGVIAEVYLECLKAHLPQLMNGHCKIFMHDNAPIHRTNIVRDWFEEQGYKVMEWPPYSLDLNPIKHLWFPTKQGIFPLASTILELTGEKNQR